MLADICCFIYYAIATIQTIPTIYRILKYKSSTDISLVSTVLSAISCLAWDIYIFVSLQTPLVYLGTIWDTIVLIVYIIVVFLYHNDSPWKRSLQSKKEGMQNEDK